MHNLTFAAAALAAGVTAFAHTAHTDPYVEPHIAAAKADGAAAQKQALFNSFGKSSEAESGDKAASTEDATPDVDPVTTASVAGAAKNAPASGKSGKGKSGTAGVTGRSAYDAIIAKHAAQHGIAPALAHAVITIESNYRASARGRAGEVGLMQIKPATARMMGFSGSTKALYNPETNIRYGMKYLAKAQQLGGGDLCGTILRYNAGHGARRMNSVSAAYCAKVKRQLGET